MAQTKKTYFTEYCVLPLYDMITIVKNILFQEIQLCKNTV